MKTKFKSSNFSLSTQVKLGSLMMLTHSKSWFGNLNDIGLFYLSDHAAFILETELLRTVQGINTTG